MPMLNRITTLGLAYPSDRYPNPVLVTRSLYLLFKEIDDSELVDMSNVKAVSDFLLADYAGQARPEVIDECRKYLEKSPDQYLEAVGGRGFEVKRYRVSLEFPQDASEGSHMILREPEEAAEAVRFADELKANYKERGFILRPTDDKKGTGVWRKVRNKMNSQIEETLYCEVRVKVIKAREGAPTDKQRYPDPKQVALEAAAAKAASPPSTAA